MTYAITYMLGTAGSGGGNVAGVDGFLKKNTHIPKYPKRVGFAPQVQEGPTKSS